MPAAQLDGGQRTVRPRRGRRGGVCPSTGRSSVQGAARAGGEGAQ